jgi:transmembrane sensor
MASSAQIEETAAAWIARRDKHGLSPAEQAELTCWLQESTAHRVAFVRLNTAWQRANRLRALGAGGRSGDVPAPGEWRHSQFFGGVQASETQRSVQSPARAAPNATGRSFGVRALAASVALAILAGGAWYLWPSANSYRTAIGGLASVPLSDGSRVTLNTDSEIQLAVTDVERRVELKQGEAFFEVAQDPRRPFVVTIGDTRVVAVGTKFSVRREAADVRVVVTEGRVRVEKSEHGRAVPITQLSAGSIARTGEGGVLVQEKPLPQAEEFLSWRTGFVVFHDTPLRDAVAELNRYNSRRIVIEDPELAALRITGNFRATNVDAFARLLQGAFPIHIDEVEQRIVLRAQ